MHVLIGAGGHAKVVIDILKAQNKRVLGLLDDVKTGNIYDTPIIGDFLSVSRLLDDYEDLLFIIAIGDNEIRNEKAVALNKLGVSYGTAIHPSAQIGSNVTIGKGSVIMPNAVLNHSAQIGCHAIINTAATIDHDSKIGDYVHISPGAHLAGNVTVHKGAHLGIGATVIQNVIIGENSQIGAGAVVIQDVEPDTVSVGVPARAIKYLK